MTAVIVSPGKANVTHHANEATAVDKRAETVSPDLVQFAEELLIIRNVAHLAVGSSIFL